MRLFRKILFLLAFLLPGLVEVCAADISLQTSEQPSDEVLGDIQNFLNVSSSLALVTDACVYPPRSVPSIILIQDVHKHPEVQSHIASLIVSGYERWGASKVFLEGAVSRVDMTVFHRLPDITRTAMLGRLVLSGDLSGPETAAVMIMEKEWRNPPVSPFELVGMEQGKLYRENLQAFKNVVTQRDAALYELNRIRHLQESLPIPPSTRMTQQLDRTEALIRLKLSPAEFSEYQEQRSATPSSPVLDPVLRSAERFYQLADVRSRVFIDEISRKYPASVGPKIVVVGGYHTAMMTAQLRRMSKSFVVLTPRLTQRGNDPLYERRMIESLSALRVDREFEATKASSAQ